MSWQLDKSLVEEISDNGKSSWLGDIVDVRIDFAWWDKAVTSGNAPLDKVWVEIEAANEDKSVAMRIRLDKLYELMRQVDIAYYQEFSLKRPPLKGAKEK